MANVHVRNLPDAVHRALRVRAAHHGRSTEAEIRHILEAAVRPPERVKLGSLLASIAREAGGLTAEEHALFESVRDKTPAEPMRSAER
ncbi:MAG: plasmid stability protein stbC [Pseudomonadota bacterium]